MGGGGEDPVTPVLSTGYERHRATLPPPIVSTVTDEAFKILKNPRYVDRLNN